MSEDNQTHESGLERELSKLVNVYCQEGLSDTPDFIVAQYLLRCLDNFNKTVERREDWYGRKLNKNKEVIVENA
jgi:hypothetical protein